MPNPELLDPSELVCQKHLFDIPADITYLNSAYMGPMPKAVQAASHAALQLRVQPWNLQPADFFTPGEIARQKIAALINGKAEQICFVPNVANAFAILENYLRTHKANYSSRNKIIVLGEQFPSNIYPWQNLLDDGFTIHTVDAPNSVDDNQSRTQLWNKALLQAIDSSTALVAIEPAHWTDGTLFNLPAIAQQCQAHGALLAIDGTQTIGIESIDMAQLQPTVYVAHPYKSLLCNYGLAFAYYATELLESKPLEEHWLMRHGAEDFSRLVDYQPAYASGARRFDSSNRANPSFIMMLLASLEQFEQWQPARIRQYLHAISEEFCATLRIEGYEIAQAHERCANIIGLRPPKHVAIQSLAAYLRVLKIYVSVRGSAVRVSPHIYNDATDLKKLSDALIAFGKA